MVLPLEQKIAIRSAHCDCLWSLCKERDNNMRNKGEGKPRNVRKLYQDILASQNVQHYQIRDKH